MLNEQQKEVVLSDEPRILCIAGAGTGKTYTLIERVKRIANEIDDPRSILVLTFTNAAAIEMQSRYQNGDTSIISPEFRTFHSFCYKILASDIFVRSKLGYTEIPEILDDAGEKLLIKKAKLSMNINLTNKQIEGKAKLSPRDQFQLEILNKAIKRQMVKDNTITFDSLSENICKLFENEDDCVKKYINKYRYIFVDEFQDTDPGQWRFVKSFKDSHLFVVGDALQAIYAFRGADSSIIKSVASDMNWKSYKLFYNYRSCSRICDFANMNTIHADDSYRLVIRSDKQGGDINLGSNTMGNLMKSLNVCLESGGHTAILARTNKEVNDIVEFLKDMEIDIVYKKSDYSLNILRSTYDKEYCMMWLASMLQVDDYSKYIRKISSGDYSVNNLIQDFQYNKELVENARKIAKVIDIAKSDEPKMAKIQEIVDFLGIPIHVIDETIKDMKDLYKCASEAQELDESSSVYVGTIHSVKGLEYDNVILSGVDGKTFPLSNEENLNLYYVGITRAKNQLFVLKGR